jgi:hypothetical protein
MNKNNIKNMTLDSKHSEMLKRFKNNELINIPKYKQEIVKIEHLLKTLKTNKKKSEKIETLNNKLVLLKNNIYKMEKEKSDYYLNNSKYIFEYFEEKKNITKLSKNNDLLEDIIDINSNSNIINESINESINFPKLINNSSNNNSSNNNSSNNNSSNNNSSNNNISNKKINDFFYNNHQKNFTANNNINNNTTCEKYFYNIDKTILNYNNYCYETDICKYCHNGEMIYVESDGICICNNCSKTLKYLIENEKPSYKEPPKEVCFYAYKRINHLREILAQFQAKESTHIPEQVYESIKNQIKKERIEIKDLTNKKTKEILKNLGFNKYYEHIPFIKDKLGIKPPVMSHELEETLCNLFMDIQKPYSKYCPKDRVNFLNYYYTLYKLCELLNERSFLPYFPMLKDREKRIEQDIIWKKICEELNWEFIPTE